MERDHRTVSCEPARVPFQSSWFYVELELANTCVLLQSNRTEWQPVKGAIYLHDTHVWNIEKVAFNCSFSSPKTHARARTHTYTCTQTCRPLFEVSTQTRTLKANLEGIKSRRLSSVLSWFPSLHGTAKSRISKACPKVTGCLLGFPRSASHMPEDSRRLAMQEAVCSSSSQSASPSPQVPTQVLEQLEDRAHLGWISE